MKIDSKMVKEIRDRTGAGIMACKQALQQADGNFDAAVEILRKEGQAKLDKRSGRQAREGLIRMAVAPDGKKAALIELNCETDFVSRTDDFAALADWVIGEVMARGQEAYRSNEVVDKVREVAAKTGEKMEVSRALLWEKEGFIGGYLHFNSRVAALVELNENSPEVSREVAMQVAVSNPDYLEEADVPPEVKDKEMEIAGAQFADKPEPVREKIVEGKWRKRLTELCLVNFPYMRDDHISIGDYVTQTGGETLRVVDYIRWQLGESPQED